MKRIIFIVALVMAAQVTFGQAASAPKADFAVASVDNLVHDFGKIKQNVPVTHEFTFVNKGKVPMIITNAQPSCGCTVPSWTKEPIPPGGSGSVKATFNAAAVGAFDKSVTVTANVDGGVIMLRIRGEVLSPVPNE
jgi:Protein of unknown function (DUF1573)